MIFPTILGRGKRLFAEDIGRLKLTLRSSTTIGRDGVLLQIYARDK